MSRALEKARGQAPARVDRALVGQVEVGRRGFLAGLGLAAAAPVVSWRVIDRFTPARRRRYVNGEVLTAADMNELMARLERLEQDQ
jgi:hypothetical protein